MAKLKKLEELTQADGKIETFKPTTLDQILGATGSGKYGTLDETVYLKSLNNMQKVDLQTHATQVGLVPVDDRERLVKRLLTEFRQHVSAFRRPASPTNTNQRPISSEVAKILAEGR